MVGATQAIRFCKSQDGLRIAYATMGRGLPLVRAAHFLTHLELDLQSPVWRPWLDELGRDRLLVRYDRRGCGLSDGNTGPLSIDTWVADLEAVVDAASLDRFALFGCSLGCAVSVVYAARHPERVSCVVVLSGYARGPMKRDPTPTHVQEARMLREVIELGWARDTPAYRQLFTSLFIPTGTPEQARWFNDLQRLSTTPDDAVRAMAAFAEIDVSESAMQVTCPALVLHSRGDSWVPFEEGRRLACLIPDACFVPLESVNHVPLRHEPAFARCFEEVHPFLDAHSPAQPRERPFPQLTPRERDLLELLAHGLDNLQIAAYLGLSEKTVRNKVSTVFDKLDVATRAQAIVRARDAGFGVSPLPR
jgi:pimeloyl-ACP methyl ester carboxylesterase/DNA-binding CsgD family transcriptional regulator